MSHIDWNVASKGSTGRGIYIDHHGKVSFRDGTSEKSAGYRVVFYSSCPEELHQADHIILGVNGSDVFFTTKDMPNKRNKFPVQSKDGKKYTEVYGKDLVTKIIKHLSGIDPSGEMEITFDVKKVNDELFKIIDADIV